MTQKDARKSFWIYLKNEYPDLYSKGKISKRQNEQVADIRVMWCEYVDQLLENGYISENKANNFTL